VTAVRPDLRRALALALGPVILCGARVHAEPATGESKPAPAVRVTTFLMPHPDVDEQLVIPLQRELDDALKHNPRLEMKELDTRLAEFAQDAPTQQIEEGRRSLREGQEALQKLELPSAVKLLTQAVEGLSRVLPHIKKQELADAMMALGVAQFEGGDRRSARATFVRLYTWRLDYRFDPNRYPPQLLGPIEEARKEVERQKRGSLEIRSEPAAVQAYVDGKYVGVTPTFAEGLPVGEHFVTLKRGGFKKAVTPALVSAKLQQLVSVTLERSDKYLLIEQALNRIETQLGQVTLDRSVDNLREALFLDHAVFVRPVRVKDGGLGLEVYLYDLRTRRQLAVVKSAIADGDSKKQIEPVATALYANVDYNAELVMPNDEAPPPRPVVRKKFYKTWWFWTVAGVAAAGLISVVVAVPLTQRPKECGAHNLLGCPSFTF
jgi:hypothetical protein